MGSIVRTLSIKGVLGFLRMAALSRVRQRNDRPRSTWFERGMAAIALVNLCLVLFDLSYIRFRDVYLRVAPQPTIWYGEQFKGIEPERTTVGYLALVDELQAAIKAQLDTQSDESSRAIDFTQPSLFPLLSQLREQSAILVDEDPFAVAGKSGTLERIKNLMRERMQQDSSKAAFRSFWSPGYLTLSGVDRELIFFNEQIRPLMATNYFRGISESGGPIDLFWRIDIGFMGLFFAEFLARTYVLSRRHANNSWTDAMLWRIYDVPLWIGFWRWLRVLPVVLRLHQACWIDLEPVRNRVSHALVSQFAVELTEIVLLRVMDQMQNLLRDGDISRWLLAATDRRRYVDINGVDEIQTITKHLSDVLIYQVLPKIKPELDALLQHSVIGALQQAPAYQGMKFMPGFDALSAQISHQVVAELSQTLTQTLQSAFADEKAADLTSQLVASFGEHLRAEMQKAETLDEVRGLITDLLEEIKINYIEGIASEDREQLQALRYQIYTATQQVR